MIEVTFQGDKKALQNQRFVESFSCMVSAAHKMVESKMTNKKALYVHNDHFMYDLPECDGCVHWARIFPKDGIVILQRLRQKPEEQSKIWPAEGIAVFRLKGQLVKIARGTSYMDQNGVVKKAIKINGDYWAITPFKRVLGKGN